MRFDADNRITDEGFEVIKDVVNAKANPIRFLSIDPGKSNGVCGYDAKYYLQFMLTIHEGDILKFLDQFQHIEKCILEDYRVYRHKAASHTGSDLLTTRVIGRVEAWTDRNAVMLIKQMPSDKPTGYKWLGKKPLPKSDPMNHALDAHIHFMFYCIKNGYVNLGALLNGEDSVRK